MNFENNIKVKENLRTFIISITFDCSMLLIDKQYA